MKRREFPNKVKLAAWRRADGHCEEPGCGAKLFPGNVEYDHATEDFYGGEPTLDNCVVLCKAHHDAKTAANRPAMDKVKRLEKRRAGISRYKGKLKSRGFPCKWCGRAPCKCEEQANA